MTQAEHHQRQLVVTEALSWERTPYHHRGRIKGAGVDCAMYLAEVFHRVGLIPHVDPGYYPSDWHVHRDEERYLDLVRRFARQVLTVAPLPGDVVMYRMARCRAHGAIVISWPTVIHALRGLGVTRADATHNARLVKHQDSVWRYFGWE